MARKTPPFNALYTFVITAKHLNLTHAAKELFVTQGAVSRQIATLEDYLGYRVFQRHARGLTLTQDGEALLPEVQKSFDTLIDIAKPYDETHGNIRLKAPTCSMRWLVPNLMALQDSHPSINVSLTTTTDHHVDFNAENFDAAVIYSRTPINQPNCIKLFDEAITPVIASHLYSKATFLDWQQWTYLHPAQNQTDWQLWLDNTGNQAVSMEKNQYFDTMDLAISAAIQGFGIAMADAILVEEDLKMNRLIRPSEQTVKTGASYYLIHRPGMETRPALSEFIQWMS
ncbi:LysR substrate-binding domain-containing protein [Vibrio salinus]|uniref:LysR substrate-binding domain-containing protein n=1 Tax=Vibrio salinus TaxID=2899784 RepID=UPI001E5AA9BF|nr:LysR substrate-binding domain-containing protein [Vibrio salinus]MCE0493138.1 LysR substrate-binding domain-containing protein [Vibrio salinus]